MTRQCKDCKIQQLLCAAEQSEQEATEIVAELKAENVKLKEKYQEELTVNTQLQEWQDEDLRRIAQLEKDLDLFRKAHDNEQAQRRILEQKLDKIKEFCNYCTNVEHSGCALCKYDYEERTAFILSIIEGAEDE